MATSLLYRIFGLGKVPSEARSALESEGIVLMEEGIGGSITFRNYRAPGRYSLWRKRGFAGSIVITGERFIAFAFSQRVVNVRFTDPAYQRLHVSSDDGKRLLISFQAEDFHEDRSGAIELRYRTSRARLFVEQATRA
jgi:hypothetical protein